MNNIVKRLGAINRGEYIYYHWINVGTFSDKEIMMLRGLPRTPTEAFQAAQEWALWRPIATEILKHDRTDQ
jgi:hypothetical protein